MSSGEIDCPFCAERIKAVAKKCRMCGEWLEQVGDRRERGILRWQGNTAVLAAKGDLVTFGCCMCGDENILPTSKKLRYTPPWIHITAVMGLLLWAVLVVILRKETSVLLLLCRDCKQAWSRSELVIKLVSFLGLFAFPALFGYLGSIVQRGGGFPGAGFGLLLWFVVVVLLLILYKPRHQAVCKLISDEEVHLAFRDAELVQELVRKAEQTND